jgi:uncharacterized glyoxalase superfamily metalloenzyme YdcJ
MKKIIIFLSCVSLNLISIVGCQTNPKSESSTNSEVVDQVFDQIEMRYSYKNLKIVDLDQMMELLDAKLQEYKRTDDISKLREGALIAFSRPNEDRTLEKVISVVRNPLEDEGEWLNTIQAMVDQSIAKITNEKEDIIYQVTAGIVLENIIADARPLFIRQYKTGGFETDLIEKIADSYAIYSKAAKAERRLNLMRSSSSPSEIANLLIDQKMKQLKAEKK